MSKDMAKHMRWNKDERKDDGNTLRHLANGLMWKEFDKEHEWFACESRNMRLGLANNGFNPFGNMSTTYSIWSVVLMPYDIVLNYPGCTTPGNNIDMYLRHLVDDLHALWNKGVTTYDSSTKEIF
jgi:hypothetical protein